MLFAISKEKLKLNITMEPETIYRYKLMVDKSHHRAQQMKEAITSLKQVLTKAVNNGLSANQLKVTQNSLHQAALIHKLELSIPEANIPPASYTQKYPEIALAVMIQKMEDSLTKKKELEAIIVEQEKENDEPRLDFDQIPPEVFLSSSRPKQMKLHNKKLDDRLKQEKAFVKKLQESLDTGARFQAKSNTPSEGKTNFIQFALNRVKYTFEAENLRNRTNYSVLVTSRSEEIGQALNERKKKAISDHISQEEHTSNVLRKVRSVDDPDEAKLVKSLRSKYLSELRRVAGHHIKKDVNHRVAHKSFELQDSDDTNSRIFKTEALQPQTQFGSRFDQNAESSETSQVPRSNVKVLISKRVFLRQDAKPVIHKQLTSTSEHLQDKFHPNLKRLPSSRETLTSNHPKPSGILDFRHKSTSSRRSEENTGLPRLSKPASTEDITRRLSQHAAMTITRYEGN
jgi:hypothetical protein